MKKKTVNRHDFAGMYGMTTDCHAAQGIAITFEEAGNPTTPIKLADIAAIHRHSNEADFSRVKYHVQGIDDDDTANLWFVKWSATLMTGIDVDLDAGTVALQAGKRGSTLLFKDKPVAFHMAPLPGSRLLNSMTNSGVLLGYDHIPGGISFDELCGYIDKAEPSEELDQILRWDGFTTGPDTTLMLAEREAFRASECRRLTGYGLAECDDGCWRAALVVQASLLGMNQ